MDRKAVYIAGQRSEPYACDRLRHFKAICGGFSTNEGAATDDDGLRQLRQTTRPRRGSKHR